MSKKPLVSIIIPVWNTGKNAAKLIRKLLRQGYEKIEVIAIDDGSNDDSLEILQGVEKEDKRVKVLTQSNGGASSARNAGIAVSRGDLLMFIDSDDDVDEELVEKLVKTVENSDEVMGITGKLYVNVTTGEKKIVDCEEFPEFDGSGDVVEYVIKSLIKDGRMYGVSNKIFRAEVIREHNLRFDPGRDFAEDTKFVWDYLKYAKGKIRVILEPLYIYNYGTKTSTIKRSATKWENWKKSYDDLEKWAKEMGTEKIKTKALLMLIHIKWRIAHLRSKRRAKL